MDVKSLYTVIPNDGGLHALAYFLDQRAVKEPSTHTLVRLAELVLTLTAFSFDDQHYHQIGGVTIESLSTVVTIPENLPLSDAEKSVLSKGLNFVPISKKLDEFSVKQDVEKCLRRVQLKAFIFS